MRFSIPRRATRYVLPVLLAAGVLVLAACSTEMDESGSIQPLPPEQETRESELGAPGARPLSQGPGKKGSPTWNPSGDRVAFIQDGYVVDKLPYSPETHRWTTRDFGAERVFWSSGEELAILAPGQSAESRSEAEDGAAGTLSLYGTHSESSELGVRRLADGVLAADQSFGGGPLVVARQAASYESRISLLQPEDGVSDEYPTTIGGRVTDLSVTPGGERAVFGVRVRVEGETADRFEVHVFDLSEGRTERVVRLESGLKLVGPPQETSEGIHYVAGRDQEPLGNGTSGGTAPGGTRDNSREAPAGDSSSPITTLYRIPEGSEDPEPVLGTGEDSVVFSSKASPKGDRISLLGRRDSGSPTNLYTLDLATDTLEAVTVNENMDIRTSPENLSWSEDGEKVVIVARNSISAPEVYEGSADTLLADFYNLWEVPVDDQEDGDVGE